MTGLVCASSNRRCARAREMFGRVRSCSGRSGHRSTSRLCRGSPSLSWRSRGEKTSALLEDFGCSVHSVTTIGQSARVHSDDRSLSQPYIPVLFSSCSREPLHFQKAPPFTSPLLLVLKNDAVPCSVFTKKQSRHWQLAWSRTSINPLSLARI